MCFPHPWGAPAARQQPKSCLSPTQPREQRGQASKEALLDVTEAVPLSTADPLRDSLGPRGLPSTTELATPGLDYRCRNSCERQCRNTSSEEMERALWRCRATSDVAAQCKAELAVLLLTGQVRSRCPQGEMKCSSRDTEPISGCFSKQKKPSLWFALWPLTPTVLKTFPSQCGQLHALGGAAGRQGWEAWWGHFIPDSVGDVVVSPGHR